LDSYRLVRGGKGERAELLSTTLQEKKRGGGGGGGGLLQRVLAARKRKKTSFRKGKRDFLRDRAVIKGGGKAFSCGKKKKEGEIHRRGGVRARIKKGGKGRDPKKKAFLEYFP